MNTIPGKLEQIRDAGYEPTGFFICPVSDWTVHYYDPIEKNLAAMRARHGDSPEAAEVIASLQAEIDLYRRHPDDYSYVFYAMRRQVCTLRRWQVEDTAALTAILSERGIRDNLRDGIPYPYTEQDAKEFLTSMANADPGTLFPFAITVDGVLAGSICVSRGDNIHRRTAELGYYLAAPFRGKGIMTDAVRQCSCAIK